MTHNFNAKRMISGEIISRTDRSKEELIIFIANIIYILYKWKFMVIIYEFHLFENLFYSCFISK